MKIKDKVMKYEEVMALPKESAIRPKKPNIFFRTLLKAVSAGELGKVGFTCHKTGMEKLRKDEPCLILMNHSSFIDLKIAMTVFYPRPLNIVCTSDGFVGKRQLMRNIGCIPAKKFVTDTALVRNIIYSLRKLKSSVLMYPEASYSFDGTATPLPDSLGSFLKMLKVPVVTVKTHGAFSRDPLYNNLRLRKVKVSADIEYLLSPDDIAKKTADELNVILKECFTFDNFKWQQDNNINISESFRAEGLGRVLYKCPHCLCEGKMQSEGARLKCVVCGKEYELTERGFMKALEGDTEICHIPDWYAWQRECVRHELEDGTYRLDVPVKIRMMVNTDSIYSVGEGRLVHDANGFYLTGCEGKLVYRQKPLSSYSLYSDFFWYEIGDVICIGTGDELYYCFPENGEDCVAKTRLAAEELYKITKKNTENKSRETVKL